MAIQKYLKRWRNGIVPNASELTTPISGYRPKMNMPAYIDTPSSAHLSEGRIEDGSDARPCLRCREPSTKSKNSFASKQGPTRTPPKKNT